MASKRDILIIDKFMDADIRYRWRIMSYDTSWDLLMTVVKKIESLYYEVSIIDNECEVAETGYYHRGLVCIEEKTKIKAVYKACLEFIKKYNKKEL